MATMSNYVAGTEGGVGSIQSTAGYGNKYGELKPNDAFTIQKKFLGISKKLITMARFAQKDTKPLNEGNALRFRRYERFSINTSPISEGVTPASDVITQTTLKVELSQYGSWVPVTDVLMAMATDPIVAQVTERQAIQMAELMDTLAYNTFKAGTQVLRSVAAGTGGARTAIDQTIQRTHGVTVASQTPSRSLIDSAVRTLASNDTSLVSSVVKPVSAYNTEPVAEGYFAITHPDMRPDIENLPDFSPVEKYANYGAVLSGEVGKAGSVRFIVSTIAEPRDGTEPGAAVPGGGKLKTVTDSGGATKVQVYNILIFGQDAVGGASLSGQDSMVPKVVTPSPSSEDPLGQRGSIGYSFHYACLILQDLYMVRLESGCSSLE